MKTIESTRLIHAPIDQVFAVISDVEQFAAAVPQIKKVDYLSERRSGVGTRYRETRESNGKTQSIELEVTELVTCDRIRMVSDAGGAVWDTLFTVKQNGDAVELSMQMQVRPHHFVAGLFNRLIRGMVVKGVEADMDAIRAHCESGRSESGDI